MLPKLAANEASAKGAKLTFRRRKKSRCYRTMRNPMIMQQPPLSGVPSYTDEHANPRNFTVGRSLRQNFTGKSCTCIIYFVGLNSQTKIANFNIKYISIVTKIYSITSFALTITFFTIKIGTYIGRGNEIRS